MSQITKIFSTGLLTIAVLAGSIAAGGCSANTNQAAAVPQTQASSSGKLTDANQPANIQSAPADSASTGQAANPASQTQPDRGQPGPNGQSTKPGREQGGQPPDFENQMAQAAVTLGIDEQTLKDAFTQARSELGLSATPARPAGTPPANGDNTAAVPPDAGQPPANMVGRGMSSELLAKVAGILGIDQQTLQDAFVSTLTPPAATSSQ
jgi:hypothetical protein